MASYPNRDDATPVAPPAAPPAAAVGGGAPAPVTANVFVDITNIESGLRGSVDPGKLLRTVSRGKTVRHAIAMGSAHPDKAAELEREWRRHGFTDCQYERRLPPTKGDKSTKGEKLVDGGLAGRIGFLLAEEAASAAAAPEVPRALGTIVLLTGDGARNGDEGRPSFGKAVQYAIMLGWNVEIWSWSGKCSGFYKDLAARGQIELFFLNNVEEEIVPDARGAGDGGAGGSARPRGSGGGGAGGSARPRGAGGGGSARRGAGGGGRPRRGDGGGGGSVP